MTQRSFVFLNDKTRKIEVTYKDTSIGKGAQGIVYQVQYLQYQGQSTKHSRFLLKIYTGLKHAHQARRTEKFCRYLDKHRGIRSEELLGLPISPLIDINTDEVAIFMQKVPGYSLEDKLPCWKWLDENSVGTRLTIACGLAKAVARLHEARILHADITAPNIFVDATNHTLYLIDIDGGGILSNESGYELDLDPLVTFRAGDTPPEFDLNPNTSLTVGSDDWVTAVYLLRILTADLNDCGIVPFQIYGNEELHMRTDRNFHPWPDESKVALTWRQPQSSLGRMSYYELLIRQLKSMGIPVYEAFRATFGRGRLGFEQRTSSRHWYKILEEARRWLIQCNGCGKEIVGMGNQRCPWCREPILHASAIIRDNAGRVITNQRIIRDREFANPWIRIERTKNHKYILKSAKTDQITINRSLQTRELGRGTHRKTIEEWKRPRWKIELTIPR